jgi:hypothetical protein
LRTTDDALRTHDPDQDRAHATCAPDTALQWRLRGGAALPGDVPDARPHTHPGIDGAGRTALAASGGGPAFMQFIATELIPHIPAQYRTEPYRVFVGHSLAGITALDALYTMPETFNAYMAIDPSLGGMTARCCGVPVTIDDHGSVPLIAEYDALRFIFDGHRVPVVRVMDEPALLTAHFQEVSARLGVPFGPFTAMLGMLSQFALARDTATALELGGMRVELYPGDARGYEFLGDVWSARNDTAQARRWYGQALDRAGEGGRVREKLEKLGGRDGR